MREYIYDLPVRMKNRVSAVFFLVLTLFIVTGMLLTGVTAAQDFSGTPTTGTAPLEVQFTDESADTPTGWAWYFGNEDWTAKTWTEVDDSDPWSGRRGHSSVVLPDGSIVLMGGYDGSLRRNDVWRSVDQGANWTEMTPSADWAGRLLHTSVALQDGSIILMGGHDGSDRRNDVWRSVDQGATWTQTATLEEWWSARYGLTSVVLPDGSIVVMGGTDNSDRRNDIWRSVDQGATWTQVTASADWGKRESHTSVVLPDGSIVLMGGNSGSSRRNDIWRSEDQGATWTDLTSSGGWTARENHTSVVLPDGSIILMGGETNSPNNDVWRSSDRGTTWTEIKASAEWAARWGHTSVVLPDGSIVLLGGHDGSQRNDVWRMETASSADQNPEHTYTEAGTYDVALQAYDGDGFGDIQKQEYIEVTPPTTPTVTTTAVSTFDATSATMGGNVTANGGVAVSDRGIVWNTTGTPDTGDNQVAIGTSTGTFSQSVGLLPFGTTIYVRAYATNTEGTAYGGEESFTTSNTVTVDLTGAEGWRLLSAPASVSLATFLGPIWTQGATTGGDTDFGTPNVYTWSTSVDGNNQGDWQAVTDLTGTTLAGGHGFMVQVYADPDYDGSTSPGFPQTLSVTGSEFVSGTSPTMNSNATGWTLLGNPFASAIDYEVLTKSNLASPIYVWNPNDNNGDANGSTEPDQSTGSWNTWNGSVGDVAGGRIAPFQGFLVQNDGSVGSVSFTQASKTTTPSTFLGKEKEIPFVRLELQGQGMRNSTWLEFSSDGSTEKIDADAWELTPLSSNYAILATRKADGSLMDIGRYPQSSELEIPLVTEATQSGKYVLNVTDFEAPGQALYLNDLQTGESILMEADTRYEFTIHQAAKAPSDPFANVQGSLKKQAAATAETSVLKLPKPEPMRFKQFSEPRFVIQVNPKAVREELPAAYTLSQNYPNPFNPTTMISYELPQAANVQLQVYDMAGRQVATLVNEQVAAGRHTVSFNAGSLSSGVYMYRLQTESGVFTKKLTLIK